MKRATRKRIDGHLRTLAIGVVTLMAFLGNAWATDSGGNVQQDGPAAQALAQGIVSCLLWWPVAFLVVRAAFKLRYKLRPYISGYALSSLLTATLDGAGQSLIADMFDGPLVGAMENIGIPITSSIVVALALAHRFRETTKPGDAKAHTTVRRGLFSYRDELYDEKVSVLLSRIGSSLWACIPAPARTWMTGARKHFVTSPGAWIAGLAALLVILSISFPPWLEPLGRTGLQRSAGRGTFFAPPAGTLYGQYAHIDYGRLAFEVLLIVAGAAITWLILRALIAAGAAATRRPEPLVEQAQEVAGRLVVQGYRKLGAARGCPPTEKTSDSDIVDIYRRVATAFRAVAESRGERITAGILNFISWKFLLLNENMGREVMLEHLDYEVEKYRSEGLRPEYRQELKLS